MPPMNSGSADPGDASIPRDPNDPEGDPHALWAQARREAPVQRGLIFGRPGYWVHRWDDVEAALREGEALSCSVVGEMMGPFMGEVLNSKDGAEHTRYRNLVSRAFRQSAVDGWEDELIAPAIHDLIDAIAPRGRADLVRDVTRRYPMRVIAGIMGVPLRDQDQFMRWAEAINLGPLHPEQGRAASRAMREYLEPIVADRRRHPRQDLISDLVHVEVDGEKLDDAHLYGFLRLLLPAGAETTFRVMGNCLFALLAQPEALARVRSDPARLLPEAIEETLRWETSVTMVNRVAVRPLRIGGQEIAAGEMVALLTSSANRDESRFAHPERWDLDRPDKRHLAFGWGRHVCLGMHLARLELRLGVGALLARLPGLRLDPDAPAPQIRGLAFRGPDALPVVFEAAR
jgi:cytochrome P450